MQIGQELHGLNAEPKFIDPVNADYSLSPQSSLIDLGLIIPGINDVGDDAYQGKAPDIGAYESSPASTFIDEDSISYRMFLFLIKEG